MYTVEQALRSVVDKTCNLKGSGFFEALALQIADVLKVDYVTIGRLLHNEKVEVETLAFCTQGKCLPNLIYPLSGTPCENLTYNAMCFHGDNVQQAYPQDAELQEISARSYIGVAIVGLGGRVLGLINALDSRPMQDKRRELALSFMHTMANRCAVEIEYQQREKELENRVARRTQQLQQTVDMLEQAQQQLVEHQLQAKLGHLSASVSHKISTPLGNILVSNSQHKEKAQQLLQQLDGAGLSKRELIRFLQEVITSFDNMSNNIHFIDSLLDRLKSMSMLLDDYIQVDLQDILDYVIAECEVLELDDFYCLDIRNQLNFAPRISKKGILEVIRHLFKNAVIFGRDSTGKAHIQIEINSNELGWYIRVCDHGPGLSALVAESLHTPLSSLSLSHHTPGLGLQVVSSLVNRMGGTLDYTNGQPKVAVFVSAYPLMISRHTMLNNRGIMGCYPF